MVIVFGFQGTTASLKEKSLVALAWWTHLFPSRTQKLSTTVATIPGEPGKIARCWAFFLLPRCGVITFNSKIKQPWWFYGCFCFKNPKYIWRQIIENRMTWRKPILYPNYLVFEQFPSVHILFSFIPKDVFPGIVAIAQEPQYYWILLITCCWKRIAFLLFRYVC